MTTCTEEATTIAPGLYKAKAPKGDEVVLLVEWRNGILRGSTVESAERRRNGYNEGPGVAVVDLHGWHFERIGGLL